MDGASTIFPLGQGTKDSNVIKLRKKIVIVLVSLLLITIIPKNICN